MKRTKILLPALLVIISLVGWSDTKIRGDKIENQALKLLSVVRSGPQRGQIIVDPEHAEQLVYNKDDDGDGKPDPFFMCGPGSPEGFLYRGTRNPDGTRDGDQTDCIDKLKANGGNCIYLMAVRTHGGDAYKDNESNPDTYPDKLHNPFIDGSPYKGLNQNILDQWESWFTEMDNNGIVIFFFFYDDEINVGENLGWPLDESCNLHPGERNFIQTMVNKFEHHKHLIWCVMEEGQEIGADWKEHISKIAEAIRQADDYDHVIASHQLSGNDFLHADDENLEQFAIQTNADEVATLEDMHNWVVEAYNKAGGRYNINMAEDSHHKQLCADGDRAGIRKRNWAAAMAGAYVMVFGMDISSTPAEQLRDCRRLQRFFESVNFNEMSPRDDLACGGSRWVLAKPGDSYIAYSDDADNLGIKGMSEGTYELRWFDAVSGDTIEQRGVSAAGGDQSFKKPAGIGREAAVYIKRTGGSDNITPTADAATAVISVESN